MTFSNILKRYWKNNDFVVKLRTKKRLASLIEELSLNSLFSYREFLVYKRFHNVQRKEEWLYGRFILKDLIRSHFSMRTAIPLNKIETVTNGKYKPDILLNGGKLDLDHSLSHSKDLFLAVLSKRRNILIGADVEYIKDIKPSLLSYFLNKKEIDEIKELEPDKKRALLFQYWTIKEATLKTLGIGLQGTIKGILINTIENNQASITISIHNLYSAKIREETNISCYTGIVNNYAIAITKIAISNI